MLKIALKMKKALRLVVLMFENKWPIINNQANVQTIRNTVTCYSAVAGFKLLLSLYSVKFWNHKTIKLEINFAFQGFWTITIVLWGKHNMLMTKAMWNIYAWDLRWW